MTKLVDLPSDVYKKKLSFGFFSDFTGVGTLGTEVPQDGWVAAISTDMTAIALAAGTTTASKGGVLRLSAGTTDNNGITIAQVGAPFIFQNNRPIMFGARVRVTEGNTDDANAYVGLHALKTKDLLKDNGAGPSNSGYEAAGFYKVDSSALGTVANSWFAFHLNDDGTASAGEVTDVELIASNTKTGTGYVSTSGSWQTFDITILPNSSTQMRVMYYINGKLVYVGSDRAYATTPTAMYATCSLKAGGTHTNTLDVDYVYCYQTRDQDT